MNKVDNYPAVDITSKDIPKLNYARISRLSTRKYDRLLLIAAITLLLIELCGYAYVSNIPYRTQERVLAIGMLRIAFSYCTYVSLLLMILIIINYQKGAILLQISVFIIIIVVMTANLVQFGQS